MVEAGAAIEAAEVAEVGARVAGVAVVLAWEFRGKPDLRRHHGQRRHGRRRLSG